MSVGNGNKADRDNEEIRRLAKMPDKNIDTSDIPEVSAWGEAKRGTFYRPKASKRS